jgi:drug/metabolite transporter (DMT)-like permease
MVLEHISSGKEHTMLTQSFRTPTLSADLAALFVVTIWGTNFVFQKAAFAEFEVWAFLCLRFMGMLLLSWAVLLYRRQLYGSSMHIHRGDLGRFACAGLLGYTCYIGLWTLGLASTTAFSGALLLATVPIFTALFLGILRIERITVRHTLSTVGASLGVVLFLLEKTGGGMTTARWGDGLSLLASGCFAAYTIVNKPLLRRYAAPVVTAYTMTLGGILLVCVSAPAMFTQDWSRVTLLGWSTLLWSIVFPVYVTWTIWSWVNARVGVARPALYMSLIPIIGGTTSWLVLHESFNALKILGALVTLGSIIVARQRVAAAPTAPSITQNACDSLQTTAESTRE